MGGVKIPTDFDREWGRFPGSVGRAPMLPVSRPITPQPHVRQRLAPIMMLQVNVITPRHACRVRSIRLRVYDVLLWTDRQASHTQ